MTGTPSEGSGFGAAFGAKRGLSAEQLDLQQAPARRDRARLLTRLEAFPEADCFADEPEGHLVTLAFINRSGDRGALLRVARGSTRNAALTLRHSADGDPYIPYAVVDTGAPADSCAVRLSLNPEGKLRFSAPQPIENVPADMWQRPKMKP